MSVLVKIGTTEMLAHGDNAIPTGYVEYIGEVLYDADDSDGLDTLMVWDGALTNIRAMTNAEVLVIAKKRRRRALREVSIQKSALIYDFIKSPDVYLFALDLYTAIKPASRNALSGRLLEFKTVKDTFDLKKTEINALTTLADVRAYDIAIGW